MINKKKHPAEENQTTSEFADQDELSLLMREYGQRVLWLSYSYVKDKNLAEDITQDVFLNCYEKLGTFREESSIKTWIYRITTNRCKDVMKSRVYKYKKVTQSLFDQFVSKDDTPEVVLMRKAEEKELSLAVLALPLKYREVIFLYYFENLKVDEISKLLSINANTVKTRLFRGRELIKQMYERGEENGR
ncbi:MULTISPECIES: sigma-70 family RNA polymerase sigma factor [unclassified Fictibacillus]|uniref:sigma-70 family RNA polymerase sigma factor n=1 Tax=unclassified Fictibacillus TaxID=2644029 RepID=UPI001E338E5E|nr:MULTISPECIES: sigma-70 family RNA polymerase sigma factor [unclassified Fictibacillus]